MAHINLYFVLLDPKRIPQRIAAGDLGREAEDWTLDRFLSDDDAFTRTFTRLSDKVASAPIQEEHTAGTTILGDGWVELAIQAYSMAEALIVAQTTTLP